MSPDCKQGELPGVLWPPFGLPESWAPPREVRGSGSQWQRPIHGEDAEVLHWRQFCIGKTNINKLKRIQNQALRIVRGSKLKSDIQHLHSETEEHSLSNHLTIVCSQFLASALRPIHASCALATQCPGWRPTVSCHPTELGKFKWTCDQCVSNRATLSCYARATTKHQVRRNTKAWRI